MTAAARRVASVARKEALHIARDPAALFFALLIPALQLLLIGLAVDTNVRHVPTAVLDRARTQESRALTRQFANTGDFAIVARAGSDRELYDAVVAGRARAGIVIPADYSRRLLAGRTAEVLVAVDGSDPGVAAEVVNVGQAIALRASLRRALGGRPLSVECRPRVLFNPDSRSSNFFIPGLMVILCQMVTVVLTATSIIREKEAGTLEQLRMTPVRPAELILGKLAPYLALTLAQFCLIAALARALLGLPMRGSFATLLALALPFVLTKLGLGLWISARSATRAAALQLAMGALMPSIFLSGYVFPIEGMPPVFRGLAQALPTTWMIDAARGVILRGAGWRELARHAAVLWGMAATLLAVSIRSFRR